MTLTTTLEKLRKHGACVDGYNKLVCSLIGAELDSYAEEWIGTDHAESITIAEILESNGLADALWALRAFDQTPEMQRAERLYGVWCARQVQYLMADDRSINALDVAERFANGAATGQDFAAASDAARDAASDAAWDAARAAAWAAARDAAWAAARDAQKQMFIAVFCGEDLNIDAMYENGKMKVSKK